MAGRGGQGRLVSAWGKRLVRRETIGLQHERPSPAPGPLLRGHTLTHKATRLGTMEVPVCPRGSFPGQGGGEASGMAPGLKQGWGPNYPPGTARSACHRKGQWP